MNKIRDGYFYSHYRKIFWRNIHNFGQTPHWSIHYLFSYIFYSPLLPSRNVNSVAFMLTARLCAAVKSESQAPPVKNCPHMARVCATIYHYKYVRLYSMPASVTATATTTKIHNAQFKWLSSAWLPTANEMNN